LNEAAASIGRGRFGSGENPQVLGRLPVRNRKTGVLTAGRDDWPGTGLRETIVKRRETMKSSKMMLLVAVAAGLVLVTAAGCDKSEPPANSGTTGSTAPVKTEVPSVPAKTDKPADKPVDKPAPVAYDAKADAKKVADKAWAVLSANYNKKSTDPKNPMGDTWGPDCNTATTAFIVLGGLRCGLIQPDDKRVKDSIASIISRKTADGAYDFGKGARAVYITSVVIDLFSWLRDHAGATYKKEVDGPIKEAMAYIKSAQIGAEGESAATSKKETDAFWGGWAYSKEEIQNHADNGKPRGNLSTSIFALDAAAAFGLEKTDPLWERATTFLMRNHNAGEVAKDMKITSLPGKDKPGKEVADPPANDPSYGGARYSPESTMATEQVLPDGRVILTSYGSMTYALLRGYLHAGLKKEDTRVQLAAKWIERNFDVTKVPGLTNTAEAPKADQQGYYYQFMQMARTLSLYGKSSFEDQRGIAHDWQKEMITQIGKLQQQDGLWVNGADRWNEGATSICTGYILNALGEILATK
jgi:hypothetical protein